MLSRIARIARNSLFFASAKFITSAFLCMLLASLPARAELTVDTAENRERLEVYVGMYNELADRRRKIIYTGHPVSPTNGVLHEFVHVSSGSSAFGRTDLVASAPMPIVVRRVYDSARKQSTSFGPGGWGLTIREEIRWSDKGSFVYSYGNGTSIAFNPDGSFQNQLDAFMSDVSGFEVADKGRLTIQTRSGISKTFDSNGKVFRLSKVVDAFGNTQEFKYELDKLVEISTDSGASVRFEYTDSGLSSITDTAGRTVKYSYNKSGRLSSVRDFREQEWKYFYNPEGLLEVSVSPNGIADLEFDYDDQGRVTEVLRNGVPTRFDYNASKTFVTDAMDQPTLFERGDTGLTQRVLNAAGIETAIKLNEAGLPSTVTRNRQTTVQIDYHPKRRRLVSVTVLDGDEAFGMRVDRLGRITSMRAAGNPSGSYKVVYRKGGDLSPVRVIRGDGAITRVSYNPDGFLSSYSDSLGQDLSVHYRSGESIRYSNQHRRSAMLLFDELGQLRSVQPRSGDGASFDFDGAGLRKSAVLGADQSVGFFYDATGNLLSTVLMDGSGTEDTFVYNLTAHNRLESIEKEGEGAKAEFAYDSFGLPSEARSTEMVGLEFVHDSLGRLVSIVPDGYEELEYSYDAGEPSVAKQFDAMTSRVHKQLKELSPFASRDDVYLRRLSPSNLGFLRYDQSTQEFRAWIDPQRWSPAQHVEHMLNNTKIRYLLKEDGPDYAEFAKPSNRYFIPPELHAINCCFCCPGREYYCEIP